MTSRMLVSAVLGVPFVMLTAPPARSTVARDAIARLGVSGPPRYPVESTTLPQVMALPAGPVGVGVDAQPAAAPHAASNGTSVTVSLVLMTAPLSDCLQWPMAASRFSGQYQIVSWPT